MLDFLITNAEVYDGNGGDAQYTSVGIQGDRIVHIGEAPVGLPVGQTIDAYSKILCPGFVDTHGAPGPDGPTRELAEARLFQGITSEVVGRGSRSPAPLGDVLHQKVGQRYPWRSLGEWFQRIEQQGLWTNVAALVGHSTLRRGVCGDTQQIGPEHIRVMGAWLDQALNDGALGLATDPASVPGTFASPEELQGLLQVVVRHSGLWATRPRDERQQLEAAITEATALAASVGVSTLLGPLRAAETSNWGKIADAIRRVEEARSRGVAIDFEVVPYDAVALPLRELLPPEFQVHGIDGLRARLTRPDWRKYAADWLAFRGVDCSRLVMTTDSPRGVKQRDIAELAGLWQKQPADALMDLVAAEPNSQGVYRCLSRDDVDAAVLANDAIVSSGSPDFPIDTPELDILPHPAVWASITRVLERFAIEGLLPFADVIRRITSLPADRLGLVGRGRLVQGAFADIVLLDPGAVKAHATFQDPNRLSEGVEKVWVNGKLVLAEGSLQGEPSGRALRRGHSH
ncbi:MAG: amidohydrolase family protein [Acidobacteriota bacterium]